MLEKVDPLKGPITRPVVVRQEEGDEQGGTHRGGGRKSEIYGFFDSRTWNSHESRNYHIHAGSL